MHTHTQTDFTDRSKGWKTEANQVIVASYFCMVIDKKLVDCTFWHQGLWPPWPLPAVKLFFTATACREGPF